MVGKRFSRGDKRFVVTAAGAAQKAADGILGGDFFVTSERGEQYRCQFLLRLLRVAAQPSQVYFNVYFALLARKT